MKKILVLSIVAISVALFAFADGLITTSSSGSGDPQTPWESDIDGGGFSLTNVGQVNVQQSGASPSRIDIYETNKTYSSAIEGPKNLTNNITWLMPTNPPTSNTNLAIVAVTSGGTGVTNQLGYVADSAGSGGFPLSADGNAATFAITNTAGVTTGPAALDTLPGTFFVDHGTNNSAQPVLLRLRNTNSTLFIDFSVNGAAYVNAGTLSSAGILATASSVAPSGNVLAGGSLIQVAAAGAFVWGGTRAEMLSPADGVISLQNAANADFAYLIFGLATAAFPSLVETNGHLRVGDGTGNYTTSTNGLFFGSTVDTSAASAITINRQSGRVRLAASSQTYFVTNLIVTASSIVIATVATDDSQALNVKAIPSAGLITLKANAAANADTDISWFIANP